MNKYELRDPIHKRITFDDFDKQIIDHPFLQRLRYINQLSFLPLVYPGAKHDRFSHVLGAMHVARRLFGRFVTGSEVLRSRFTSSELEELGLRVRMAGLLHDIGHGPFSHASEAVFPKLNELPLDWFWWSEKSDRKAKHEDYSVLFIQEMAKEGIIESNLAQDIASFIHGGIKPSDDFDKFESKAPTLHKILKSVVSGEVDCDRMDYLLRDSYYCGIEYGKYDIDWLISSMSIQEYNGELILTISENGIRAFESMLLARYHMIDQVYLHKTKAGFVHYLEQAIETGEIPIKIPTDPYEYADMRDGKFVELMFEAAKDKNNYWSHHLMNRIPAKRILRLHDASQEDMETLETLKEICQSSDIKHFTHSAGNELSHFGEDMKYGAMIYVAKKTLGGIEYVPIFKYSDLLKKYNEVIRFTDFFVLREDVNKFEEIRKQLQ